MISLGMSNWPGGPLPFLTFRSFPVSPYPLEVGPLNTARPRRFGGACAVSSPNGVSENEFVVHFSFKI